MKRIFATILSISLLLCGCAAPTVRRDGTDVNKRLSSIAQLQKNFFVCRVLSVETRDAVILKYNVDLSVYTVYTVEITLDIDGCTPLRTAKLYQLGTKSEYPERETLRSGESYVVDADPWVYGDETVFLLSPFREYYPYVDASGMIDGQKVDSLASRYTEEWNKTSEETDRAELIASRYLGIFSEMDEKNSNLALYDAPDRPYEWKPDAAFRELTAKNTAAALGKLKALVLDAVGGEDVCTRIKEILS